MIFFTSTVSSHLDITQEYGHSVPSTKSTQGLVNAAFQLLKHHRIILAQQLSVPLYKFTEEVTQGASEIGKIFNIFLSIKHCQHQFLSPKSQRKRIQRN